MIVNEKSFLVRNSLCEILQAVSFLPKIRLQHEKFHSGQVGRKWKEGRINQEQMSESPVGQTGYFCAKEDDRWISKEKMSTIRRWKMNSRRILRWWKHPETKAG